MRFWMTQLFRYQRIAWPVLVSVLALIGWFGGQAAAPAGPVCTVVSEAAAMPTLGLLEVPSAPPPACIRVELNVAH